MVSYGQAQLSGLEEGLRSIGTHNLQARRRRRPSLASATAPCLAAPTAPRGRTLTSKWQMF